MSWSVFLFANCKISGLYRNRAKSKKQRYIFSYLFILVFKKNTYNYCNE